MEVEHVFYLAGGIGIVFIGILLYLFTSIFFINRKIKSIRQELSQAQEDLKSLLPRCLRCGLPAPSDNYLCNKCLEEAEMDIGWLKAKAEGR